jgi:hypothetical protein
MNGSVSDKHLEPAFGKMPINEITRTDVKNFIFKKIKDGMSISRAKRIKATRAGIFSHAVEGGLIVPNPAARLDRFLNAKDQRLSNEISPYTAKELEIYLESESRMERGAGVGFCGSGRQTTRPGKFARPSPLQGVRKSETAPGAHPRH